MKIQVLDGVIATNGVPTAGSATVGEPLKGIAFSGLSHNVPGDGQVAFVLKSVAGSATMTVSVKLWVYSNAVAEWVPYGTDATDDNKGLLNEGNAIAELTAVANRLLHGELVNGLHNWDRVYAQVTAIGGTDTAVDAWLVGR